MECGHSETGKGLWRGYILLKGGKWRGLDLESALRENERGASKEKGSWIGLGVFYTGGKCEDMHRRSALQFKLLDSINLVECVGTMRPPPVMVSPWLC